MIIIKCRATIILLIFAFSSIRAQVSFPKQEVRAVWLTTIGGLDWPGSYAQSSAGAERQKQQLCEILDKLQAIHINTILLQTRVRSTVIYPSVYEPWDGCFSGKPGVSPGYDPLAFAIEECHKRGMELHAWVVAFPACKIIAAKQLGKQSLPVKQPGICRKAGDMWMLDPGLPGTAEYLARICTEITQNYDIDGIHLDYIRYPEKEVPFNDNMTYNKYGHGKNKQQWRRDNVTHCVRSIYQAVKVQKPWVRVSCSPVGKYSDLTRFSSFGWNAYHAVNQDAQGWLKEGIMDMLFPMMYFQGNHFYPFALDWKESSHQRIIIPGLGVYMLSPQEKDWSLDVIQRETAFLRSIDADGQAFFRSRFLTDNVKGIYDYLKYGPYAFPALTLPMKWADSIAPSNPEGLKNLQTGTTLHLAWQAATDNISGTYVTYNLYRSKTYPVDISNPINLIKNGIRGTAYALSPISPFDTAHYYALTACDRFGNESKATSFNRPEKTPSKLLTVENDTLTIPFSDVDFILITDATGKHVLTGKSQKRISVSKLKPGYYMIRTLEKKGLSRRIGDFIIKQTAKN